jgi:rhodanese-related sulfurtransferase
MINEKTKEIKGDFVYKKLEKGAVLVDVRTEEERADDLIPGSIWIPLDLLPMHVNNFKETEDVIFYCRSGRRSELACQLMRDHGFTNSWNLVGGIVEWEMDGHHIAKDITEISIATIDDIKKPKLK